MRSLKAHLSVAAYLFGGFAKDRIAARYRRASLTDPLTGIANRRAFFQRGERLLTRARFAREPTALILFDLDRFKCINDRYGHITGDEVLISFCRLATSHLRPDDLFGRIGGEEFAGLVPNVGRHDALWLAERVRKAFEAPSTPLVNMLCAQPLASGSRSLTTSGPISTRCAPQRETKDDDGIA